jgi:hypothetical protein
MSHLLDSSLARQDTRLDITDVYVFQGSVGTAFVMGVNNSAAWADAPPGFCPNAHYDFRIDLNGDAIEECTFRVVFGQGEYGRHQPLELRALAGADARDHTASGRLMAWGSTRATIVGAHGVKLWAGLAEEPFYVEPTVLAMVRRAVLSGCALDLSSTHPATAVNAFAGTSVYTIVLEVPESFFSGSLDAEKRIGFWGTTTLATDAGGWRPINRMGLPMVQTLFNPPDDDRSSEYNTTHPFDDRANYGDLFAGLVARVVAAQGTADDPQAYGESVVRLLLPDVLPYRVGSAASFSFAGLNGRGLTDNAPEVMFSIVTNRAISDGLSRRHADGAPTAEFPYLRPRDPATRGDCCS